MECLLKIHRIHTYGQTASKLVLFSVPDTRNVRLTKSEQGVVALLDLACIIFVVVQDEGS